MAKKDDAPNEDLRLVTMLVAKQLEDRSFVGTPPAVSGHRVVESRRYHMAGGELRIDVDLGRGAIATVFDVWDLEGGHKLDELLKLSSGMADKIEETRDDASNIHAMMSEIRAAARREIAKATRRGLPYELTSVTLSPVEARTPNKVAIRVEYLALGRSLKPEPFAFHAECAEDVVQFFAGLKDEQVSRSARRQSLDHVGATGKIDAVVVAALEAAGLDVPEVLAKLRDAEDWIVEVPRQDGGAFRLHWDEGEVHAQVVLSEGVSWHNGRLHFANAPRSMDRLAKGSPLAKVFEHPFFDAGVRVEWASGEKGKQATVHCSESMLNFDADSGRLWAA